MNTVIEQKLQDLLEESRRQGAPAAHVVTHLLLACYAKGTQNDFAKWVCQYTPEIQMEVELNGGRAVLPGELPIAEPEEKQWLC